MKNKLFSLLLCGALALFLAACSDSESQGGNQPDAVPQQEIQSEPDVSTSDEVVEPDENENAGLISSGNYTLPCGMELQFWDSVRNDVTGNWRRAATSSSLAPADYALEYYNKMFSSSEEIHAVWNATLGTTTRISVLGNLLFVDTLEYVSGEEHDAKLMFSGDVLDSRIIDIETGELVED